MAFRLSIKGNSPVRLASFLSLMLTWQVSADVANVDNLRDLREVVSVTERSIRDVRVEGVVRALNQSRNLIVLDDGTTTELLELPSLPPGLAPGNRVAVEGSNCLLGRDPFAIRLGTTPVVELDGRNATLARTGKVYLHEGMRPLRVEWFNGPSEVYLSLEFETEGMERTKVPATAYWRRESSQGEFLPGLDYACFENDAIHSLADLSHLQPVTKGIVQDLDLSVRSRPKAVGLIFTGFLKVPRTGLYTFQLTADDGARFYLSDTPVTCAVIPPAAVTPNESNISWSTVEGTVTYAAKKNRGIELELTGNPDSFRASIVDGTGLEPLNLLRRKVSLTGLKRDSGWLVLDANQIRTLSNDSNQERILTKAEEIRELQADEANRPRTAVIQGVVTMVAPKSLVLQDDTGGVFVHYFTPEYQVPPQPSELWRIEGNTAAGGFSPVIHVKRATCLGHGPLPKAVQPTQQQLASGSLDAELVEIEGVVTEVSVSELKILTRSGMAIILDDSIYPLPTHLMPDEKAMELTGRVVRLRGVYRAIWDTDTGNVQPARMMLGNVTMSIDESASQIPFSAPLIRSTDLLLFTSHASAMKRVRASGQLLHARPPEFFLFDGSSGFRVVARGTPALQPGDNLEAAGFPLLGGPSPALLEAHVRKMGHSALPAPKKVSAGSLPDTRLDSTLVEIEGILLSDTVRQDERALELRAGANRFMAYVPSGKSKPEAIEQDSLLRVTGVYVGATPDRASPSSDPFELRLQDGGNITVVKRGPWWTKRRTMAVITILSTGLILTFFWVTLLRRTVAKRSRQLAVEIEERELVERHRAMEQERSRMAKDLHDELGAGLTEAGFLSSLMRNPAVPKEQKDSYLDQLNALCCTLVTGLDEIVWAVNPRYDSVADLAGYFSLYAQRFLKLAGLECLLKIDDAITKDPLDSRTRHEIFLAFKEGLNNIVRHSGASEVHLTVGVEAGNLVIFLTDNGCGFDRSAEITGGDGLRNMEERIRNLGGTCVIETRPGEGTTLRFIISLKGNPT